MNIAQPILLSSTDDDVDRNADQINLALYLILAASATMVIWIIFIEMKFIKKRNFFFELLLRLKITSDHQSKEDIDSVTNHYLNTYNDSQMSLVINKLSSATIETFERASENAHRDAQLGIKKSFKGVKLNNIN